MRTQLRECQSKGVDGVSPERVAHDAEVSSVGHSHYCGEVMWLRGDPHRWSHRRGCNYHVGPVPGGAESDCALPQAHPLGPEVLATRKPKNRQEAFVVALARCYMRWFLAIALRQKYGIDGYFDSPMGCIESSGDGRLVVTSVTLRPQIRFSGRHMPDEWQRAELHSEAYKNAITLNAVTVSVECNPVAYGP